MGAEQSWTRIIVGLMLLVFIVAYYAESTLTSVLQRIPAKVRDDFDCEILVVDDASEDRTYALGREYQQAHPEIRMTVLRNELNRVNGLYDVLYRPDQTVRAQGWPRMADLRARNQRLLIFTDHGRSGDSPQRDTFGVMYQPEWTVENHWSMGSGLGTSTANDAEAPGTPLPLVSRTAPPLRSS